MKTPRRFTTILAAFLLTATSILQAQEEQPAAQPAKADKPAMPILRLEAGGPVSEITSLAFSPDGETLYAAGYDKAVYAWTRNAEGQYEFAADKVLRIPIGPGVNDGLIKTLAISSDGRYLAAAGVAMGSHVAGFTEGGLMWPASTQSVEQRKEVGTIYVFDLKSPDQPDITHLRGHLGPVTLLTFAPQQKGRPPVLVSASDEYDPQTGKQRGGLRVWNLNQPKESIAEHFDLSAPSENNMVPRSIAAVRTGKTAKSIHVGITWGENVIRFWDVANNKTVMYDQKNSFACAEVDNKLLLAGAFLPVQNKGASGQLALWKPAKNARANPTFEKRELIERNAPIGIATASNANKALVVCFVNAGPNIGFYLADSKNLKRLSPGKGLEVFGNRNHRPAYAISPQGDYVAVAGNLDRKIRVYKANANQGVKLAQQLEGQGTLFPRVRFYAKGESLGLGLNQEPKTDQNENVAPDLLFDLAEAETSENDGWKHAPSSDTANFEVEVKKDDGRDKLFVEFNDGEETTIVLPENQVVVASEVARCPKTENHPPLVGVIVRSTEFAESILRVYNAETGERLRQFSGHIGPITSIAFSQDGKLLASAGLDHTVRVWWLEDLKKHVGQVGFLDRLQLTDKQNAATVKAIDEKYAAKDIRDNLQVDDVIQGFVRPDGGFVKTPKAFDFFYYLSTVPPGQTVELRIERNGQVIQPDPKIEVQQAVDERKPLFTLFFENGQAKKWSWIGWTPTGPFDSSDEQIEKLVGWHFNPANETDDPDAHAAFAEIGEYRDDHYKKGLLKGLIETGQPPPDEDEVADTRPYTNGEIPEEDIPPAVAPRGKELDPPPQPPEPRLSLFVKERQQVDGEQAFVRLDPDAEQRVWAQSKNIQAIFTVSDIDPSQVEDNLNWEIDGTTPPGVTVEEPRPGIFEADLSEYAWQKREGDKPYTLRVSFRTDGLGEAEYFREQEIVFAPPPPPPPPAPKVLPNVTIFEPDSLTVLYQDSDPKQIEVTVKLSPADEGKVQPGLMTFERGGKPIRENGQPVSKPFDETTEEIRATLPIENGVNQIRARLTASEGEATKLSNEVVVHFRRPPRVETIEVEVEKQKPRAKITSVIHTPVDRPLTEVLVLVNRKMFMVPKGEFQAVQDKNDKTQWTVTIEDVLISEGESTIRMIPRNADGRVQSTPKEEVTWTKPPMPPRKLPSGPKIFFANVNSQVPLAGYWQGDEYEVEFNVLAGAKLSRVLVYYNGERLADPKIPDPVNGMKYQFKLPVKLTNKRNHLRVIAQDVNVRWSENETTLASLKPPVRIKIDQLFVMGDNRAALEPVARGNANEPVTFNKPAGHSRVILRGRVITSDSTKEFQRPYVKCWVNGYMQMGRATQNPQKPTEWQFAMQIVLNREKGNRLRLELPEAPKTPASETECLVDCTNPETDQKLHLVVVGIDPDDPRAMDTVELKKQAERAFGIRYVKNDDGVEIAKTRWGNEAEVHVLPFSEVNASRITSVLKRIQVSPVEGGRQLVVFYYQGKEVQKDDQIVLKTWDRVEDKSALTSSELKRRLEEIDGAHVVMLDVTQQNKVENDWQTGEFLGMLRTVHGEKMPSGFPLASALSDALEQTRLLNQLPGAVQESFKNRKLSPAVEKNESDHLEHLVLP